MAVPPNKSLDRSADSLFLNLVNAVKIECNRRARSTQALGAGVLNLTRNHAKRWTRTMELTLRNRTDRGFLHATLSGDFSLAEAQTTFLQILESVELHKVKKVLVDGRAINGAPTTMERFYYGEFVANAVTELRSRVEIDLPMFSYVLIEPVLDPGRYGETVAVNRGMFVKTFDNLADALEWLGSI